MKKLLTVLTILLLGISLSFSQEMPSDYSFDSESSEKSGIYKVLPSEDKILSDADLGNAFQSLGIIAQPEQDVFGFVFVNGQSDYQIEQQGDKPFVFFIGDTKITGSSPKVFKKHSGKKLKVEYLTVKLSRADFERLLAAENILIVFGSINYDVSPANLQAFRYVKWKIDSDYAAKQKRNSPTYTQPTNSGGTVQVDGYYRKDGTYVRPHTRKKPKKN